MAATQSGERFVKDLMGEADYRLPIYFLQGEEPYFLDVVVDAIKATVPEAERGFNLTTLYGKETDMQRVLGDARQFPFMGERRVLIVMEAQMMDGLTRGSDGAGRLIAYLNHIQPTTCLVFCYKGILPEGQKALSAKLKAGGFFFTSPKLADWDTRGLVAITQDLCLKAQIKIDRNAVERLAQFVGNDISRLANEVQKLSLAVPAGASVTEQTIFTYIGVSRDYSIFEFQKALAHRDFATALKLAMYYAKNEKEHNILKELAFLTTFFTRLLVLKGQRQSGQHQPDTSAQGFRITPDMTKALTQYSLSQLTDIIHILAKIDRAAKGAITSHVEPGQLWLLLVYYILKERRG
jgi:DNA polymerase III subunit delta